ncbi:MAG: ABC transporter permease, partial [Burkholderiales bacterium]
MNALAVRTLRGPLWRSWFSSGLPLAAVLGVALFAWLQPAFLSPNNLVGILRQVAIVGIMAAGMTFVIMTGGIDLSIGPVLALSGLVAVLSLDAGAGLPLALLLALGLGFAIGLLNGGLIAWLGLPPIIITLAMLSIVRGSALLLGGPDLHAVRGQPAFSFIGTGSLGGLPLS